jgi:phosphohistidine phosphatase SixA
MKYLLVSSMYLWVCLFGVSCVSAQEKNGFQTTIILVRHAEKDTTGGNNPPLSIAGNARAQRLAASFPNVVPDEFYATPFVRTISTLKPWAESLGKEVKAYAAADSIKLTEMLLKQQGKTIIVTGHSNTIPSLVNRLIGSRKYNPLPDSAYSNIYVVSIENGKATDKLLHY